MSNFLNFAGNQGVTFKNHGTGGGTSFTLDKAASTNSVLVTIGGVMQATGTDYTVSGVTITTTTSVTSGIEVLSWIIHKPGTAPVIQDNSVTGAKIVNDTIDSQHYAAASIDNEHLADDAVGVAELSATGTASSSTFLRGDNAWAAAGGGKILQVVGGTVLTAQSGLTSTSFADSGIAAATLTPSATSSKILVQSIINIGISGTMELDLQLYKDVGGGGYSAVSNSGITQNRITTTNSSESMLFLDSPSTTSAVSFKVYYKVSANTVYINYTYSGDSVGSSIILMEVGA